MAKSKKAAKKTAKHKPAKSMSRTLSKAKSTSGGPKKKVVVKAKLSAAKMPSKQPPANVKVVKSKSKVVAASRAPKKSKVKESLKTKEPSAKETLKEAKAPKPAPLAAAKKVEVKEQNISKGKPKAVVGKEKLKKAKEGEKDFEDIPEHDDFPVEMEVEVYSAEIELAEAAEQDRSEEHEVEEDDRPDDEVILTDADGRRYCRVRDCDQLATVDSYCRYHYLLYWKKIQIRKKILTEGKLERYIEELTSRYPDKFLDMLRKDLRSDKEFLAAIQELEIDESQSEGEFEDEAEPFIDEVRGMSEPVARDEEDFS